MSVVIKQCDNLELLKSLPSNSIDLIYSDILYGTNRDFGAYQDINNNWKTVKEFYNPRLVEMHRVLKDNGSIYLQMDTKINHWLRVLLDDIFGYDNFINEIVWCYLTQGKTNKYWNKKHDVIVFYSKSSNYKFYADRVKESISNETYKRFKKDIDKYGYYESFKNGKLYKYTIEDGTLPKDWIEDITALPQASKEKNGYPTQKPLSLIDRFILASSDEGDTILDCFLGSGTTAHSCINLNRNFIGCDSSKEAIGATKERLEEFKGVTYE